MIEARYLMEATLADGQVMEIDPRDLKFNLWDYRHLTDDLLKDDPQAIKILQTRHRLGSQLAELRIMTFPVILTRQGRKEAPSKIIKRLLFRTPAREQTTVVSTMARQEAQ